MKLEEGKNKKYIRTSRGVLAGMLGTSEATLRTKIRQRALVAGILTDKEQEVEDVDFENLVVSKRDNDIEEGEPVEKDAGDLKIEEVIDLGDEFDEVDNA